MKIALDGPAGAGKSTIAKAIAARLNIMYLDTGAMYRSVALYMYKNNIKSADSEGVLKGLEKIKLDVRYENGSQHLYLDEEDVSTEIRENYVSAIASQYSALKPVREFLVKMQQATAAKTDCILDGRDIGTCVLPDADFKFYLTASVCERARRRAEELRQKGQSVDIEQIQREIEERDYNDSHREFSPLKKAEDAVLVDSTDMTIGQVEDFIISVIKEGR